MQRRSWMLGGFVLVGLGVALAIALFASPFASSAPDGMGRVAIDTGFADSEKASPVEEMSPVGGYALRGVSNEGISTGLAGAIGVLLTFGVGLGAFTLLSRARRSGGVPTGQAGHRENTTRRD